MKRVREREKRAERVIRAQSLRDGLVEQSGHIFLAVAVGGGEDHHTVLDRESVEVIEHHVIRLRQHVWIALHGRVLVQDHLEIENKLINR